MEWISVKDRLPDEVMGRYIACLSNGMVLEMNYSSLSQRWWNLSAGDEPNNNKVSYWMPLPEPPKFES